MVLFVKSWVFFTNVSFMPSWSKLVQWFWRRRFLKCCQFIYLNFVIAFSLFRNYLPLEKGMVLHLNKIEFLLPKDDLCEFWSKLAQWLWRRFFFLILSVYYHPLEKGVVLNLNSLHLRIHSAKLLRR